MLTSFVALAAAVTLATAQLPTAQPFNGYGRFPCLGLTDTTSCTTAAIAAFEANVNKVDTINPDSTEKGDLPPPVDATCALEVESGGFFCGIEGAICTDDVNCDVGRCTSTDGVTPGVCVGTLGTPCGGDDSICSGFLFCQSYLDGPTAADVCGGLGSYCGDFTIDAANPDATDDQLTLIDSQFCGTDLFCPRFRSTNPDEALACVAAAPVGGACTTGVDKSCQGTATCENGICTALGPSQRARSRRGLNQPISSLCPASQSACALDGPGAKFECIDTSSNLEQCGACASAGGVDCTTLPGVDAVGCIAGSCEIWSCVDGHKYDAASASCKKA